LGFSKKPRVFPKTPEGFTPKATGFSFQPLTSTSKSIQNPPKPLFYYTIKQRFLFDATNIDKLKTVKEKKTTTW
jgi:hypothetical protein